jgi:hypothetical protein
LEQWRPPKLCISAGKTFDFGLGSHCTLAVVDDDGDDEVNEVLLNASETFGMENSNVGHCVSLKRQHANIDYRGVFDILLRIKVPTL